MIKWAPYVFVRFTGYLVLGILAAIYLPSNTVATEIILAGFYIMAGVYLLLSLVVSHFWKSKRLGSISGIVGFAVLFLAGYTITYQRTQSNDRVHLLHQPDSVRYYTGVIVSEVSTTVKSHKAQLSLRSVYVHNQWRAASGKVLLYLHKDTPKPQYGDKLLVRGNPQKVPAPANPGEFDYRYYLQLQQIYHQHFLKPEQVAIVDHEPPSHLMAISITIRQKADAIFKKLIPSRQEQAIASGLVLGIRDGLDNEIKQAYASAGAMHILAVSGAHVVIVFGILAFFLRRIKKIKYGKWLFAAISLCLLWMYAFVTGLSASVLRAVIMFSFVIIADAANRQKSIYNTLAASAFGLLFYDPYLLMDVGFQLSYAAVLSIVYITPKLSRLLEVDNYVLSKAWQVSCASIAAQVGTLPLSLLYFHQFPVYFLLANLFVILLSSIILYLGIFTLLFSAVPYLSTTLSFVLKWFIWLLNEIAFLTEDMPGALIRNISISAAESCIIYLMIISFLLFLYYKKLVYWAAMVGMACVLSVFNIAEVYKQQKQQQMAFYSIAGHSAFSLIEGNHNTFLADSALLHNQNTLDFHLSGHWRQSGISQSEYIDLYYSKDTHLPIKHCQDFSLMVWHGKTFLFLSRPLHNWQSVAQLQPDYLIIQNNAIKELPDKDISFKYLLIDGNNKPYLAKKLKLQALQANIPCFSIGEEGALLLSTK